MTSGAEWRCWPGPSAQALAPGSCVTLPQSTYGCSHVPPIQTGQSVLFVQERGSRVRELRFDVLQDQYQAADMSVLSQHLLYDTSAQYQIQEWAFAEEPFRVVWCVRSDGTLLGFTFMREHEVYAWHRHTTDGRVESVCSIPEPDGQWSAPLKRYQSESWSFGYFELRRSEKWHGRITRLSRRSGCCGRPRYG
jgi:hypothetical protein